jgi:hypothetical protein
VRPVTLGWDRRCLEQLADAVGLDLPPPPDHGLVLGVDASESLLDAEPDREHCVPA